ncbi:MAG: RNA-guided endonuclease TnpB family protein [Xenococcaceae cyanobacterium MO_167.B52]|nr:RNA-guided endonuclease TnpB family protein [Xenococcaceae cyanobacterium MO_167.B52]
MKARYNYRIYPKKHQLEPLAKAMGCARVVWNDALWLYKKAEIEQTDRPKSISSVVITQAKKTEARKWLSEVSSVVLQQSLRDLQTAWNNYFESKKGNRKGKAVSKPKFKKKSSRQAIRFAKNAFTIHSESVKLAKIGQIKMVVSRPLPSDPSSVTIIKDCAGRYFASFVVEVSAPIPPSNNCSCGIDLGLTHFCILSSGEKVENPRLHKKMLKRIKKANRRLAKAKRDSNRRKKRKLKLAKLHAKVKDQRTDFLHKLTTRLVRENQTLAIEDLNVSGMVKNRKLSRAISDAGWTKFKTMLAAKCDKYSRDLIIVDRWYPSSQICSCCGQSGGRKELNVREWQCLYCNTFHDRDICAAENLNQWAGGQSDQNGVHKCLGKPQATTPHKNGRGSNCKTTNVAVCVEPSTSYEQLGLF